MKPYFQRCWHYNKCCIAEEVAGIAEEVAGIAEEVADIAQEMHN